MSMHESLILILAVSFCLVAGSYVSPAFAGWGAVALNENNGAYGISNNFNSRNGARQQALRLCRNQGTGGCVIKADFRGCAAMATDRSASVYGIGLANSLAQAQANAVRRCNNWAGGGCYVDAFLCNR